MLGALLYHMEGYPITRYKVGRIFLYYLKTDIKESTKVNKDQCVEYISDCLSRFLEVDHLPKGFGSKSFSKKVFQSYVLLEKVTIDGSNSAWNRNN